MGLDIYREVSAGIYARYKDDAINDGSLPITTTHDGVLGESVIKKLFVRSNNNTEWFEDISILPVSNIVPSEVDGTSSGHGIKLISGDEEPTEAEWDAADYASSASLSDIGSALSGDQNSYLPFWYRQECFAGAGADNRETTILRLFYTANPV